jgi:hypothetical protein
VSALRGGISVPGRDRAERDTHTEEERQLRFFVACSHLEDDGLGDDGDGARGELQRGLRLRGVIHLRGHAHQQRRAAQPAQRALQHAREVRVAERHVRLQ